MTSYASDSVEGRFLAGEREAVAEVGRWVAQVLAGPSFWSLRAEWNDLHQETLGRIVQSLRQGRFDPRREFRVYAQGVARFTGFKAIGRSVRAASDTELDPEASPSDEDEGRGLEQQLIDSQLARLALEVASAECRNLIQMYFMEEKRYQGIAEELQIPVGTVKSRLFRCMERIHERLKRQ